MFRKLCIGFVLLISILWIGFSASSKSVKISSAETPANESSSKQASKQASKQ